MGSWEESDEDVAAAAIADGNDDDAVDAGWSDWVRSSSTKQKASDKSLRAKFGLRPNLRLNLTSRQRLQGS